MLRWKAANRLGLAIILWSAICLCIGLAVLAYTRKLEAEAEEIAFSRAEGTTLAAAQAWSTSFEAIRNALQLLLLRQRLIDHGGEDAAIALELTLAEMAASRHQGIIAFSAIDFAGRVRWSTTRGAIGRDVSQQQAFLALFDGSGRELRIGRPIQGENGGEWRLEVSSAIPDPDGGILGVADVTIDPMVLNRALAALVPDASHVVTIHRGGDGALRAITREPERHLGQPGITPHPVLAAAREAPAGRLRLSAMGHGQQLLAAYRVTEALDMVVTTSIERAAALAQARRAGAMAMLAAGLLLLALLAALLALCRAAGLRDQLHDQAMRDPLTGLHNRRSLESNLRPMLDRREASGFALLLFDLDHFKRVNDQHGHAAGDAVLRNVAELLRQAVRQGDLVCRWGGEELLVVLVNCPPTHARTRAERLREAIAGCQGGAAGPVPRVTASVGVACFPHDAQCLPGLMEAADAALYRAKSAGRNRVALVAEAA